MRIAMGIEYEGTAYSGFQHQKTAKSVADCLNKAISEVAAEPIQCVCAGRTDAGVHAKGQVIHIDTQATRTEHAWLMGVNSHLPSDIAVQWVKHVPAEFHARFEATSRRYHYRILNTRARPALDARFVTWHYMPLNADLMHEGAQFLVGTHDFSAFRGRDCQAKSPIKTVKYCRVARQGDYITLDIEANAFLYHMVRNIVGTLFQIGEGKQPVHWVETLLAGKDRTQSGVTASPKGLSLLEITYPSVYNLQV